MKITVDLTKEEAAALLRFLRTVSDTSMSNLANASEKVRIALRHKLEPGPRDEMAKEIMRRTKKS